MHSKERSFSPDQPASSSKLIRSSGGLTLLELIIAFVVLQVAIVTFAQIMTSALDFSGQVRRTELAQNLAQAKMEEMIRTIHLEPSSLPHPGEIPKPFFVQARPQVFESSPYSLSEDTAPFMWMAEAVPSKNNPQLFYLTLHVYEVKKRTAPGAASEAPEQFTLSEDRERFTYTYAPGGGAAEAINGKEKLRLSSAAAFPWRKPHGD